MKTLAGLLFCFALAACSGRDAARYNETTSVNNPRAYTFPYSKLEGEYSGDFGGANMRLVLNHISPANAVGYNLHYGSRRNISGPLTWTKEGLQFELSEPGDDQYDGVFRFTIDTTTLKLKGTWTPKHPNKTSTKEFVFNRDWSDTSKQDEDGIAFLWQGKDATITFARGGLCTYQYYPPGKVQMEELYGNWEKKDNTYEVSWRKNDVFRSGKSLFTINIDSNILRGEGLAFNKEYFP